MKPETENGYGVKAICATCGVASYFDFKDTDGRDLGYLLTNIPASSFKNRTVTRVHWRLLRCSGCRRGALAHFFDNGSSPGILNAFHPQAVTAAKLPKDVPDGVRSEYREAELCVSVGGWRGASALVRSTLEKALKASGYVKGKLADKIDDAAKDGVITDARKQKAHSDVRVLGNEIVHDDWREVDAAEIESALHYTQRVLEDLYDDRPSVEAILKAKGRIP